MKSRTYVGTLPRTLQALREHYPRVYPDNMATLCFALLLVTGILGVTLHLKLLRCISWEWFDRAENNARYNVLPCASRYFKSLASWARTLY
jgi:hypothetical protein